MSNEEAIRYALEGRNSHSMWVAHLERAENCCDSCRDWAATSSKIAGSIEIHKEWVRKYDVILAALRSA